MGVGMINKITATGGDDFMAVRSSSRPAPATIPVEDPWAATVELPQDDTACFLPNVLTISPQ